MTYGLISKWLVVLLVLGHAASGFAWWDSGHRIVGLIAYRQMSIAGRAKIVKILRRHPQAGKYFTPPAELVGGKEVQDQWMFSQAAVWADSVRRTPRDRPTWHYVNFPLFLSKADGQTLAGKLPANLSKTVPDDADLDTQALNAIQAIGLCRKLLAHPSTSSADQAICVTWLFHLLGDVHQPCHSTALFSSRRFKTGDRGGNDIPLVGGRNLHAVWDSPFGTTRTFGADVLRRTATILADRSLVSAGARAMQNLNAVDWLQESSELAKRVAYHQNILTVVRAAEKQPDQALPKIALPDSYFNQLGAVARRRAVEAGFRLGRLLEVECRP